jgi:hypothetical protein
MKTLWTQDYNELHKDFPENWKIFSRKNQYNFIMKNGSTKNIEFFCSQYKIKSIIDYGCGFPGNHFKSTPEISIYNYDPFIEEYSIRPTEPADMVICYNVLNIIEPDCFDDVLDDINDLTNKIFLCNIRIPGHWLNNYEYFVDKISYKFKTKRISHSDDKKYLGKSNLFILAEKNSNLEIEVSV